jgi:uncharacterized membrane protein
VDAILLYGIFGWCAEIVWTATSALGDALRRGLRIDRRLMGHTYLWMFPIYGCGGRLFEVVHALARQRPWPLRGVVYMLGCFVVEYAAGWLIQRATGRIPWDYSDSRWHVRGLIRLDYAPVWFVFGLLLERVERVVHAAAPALGMITG